MALGPNEMTTFEAKKELEKEEVQSEYRERTAPCARCTKQPLPPDKRQHSDRMRDDHQMRSLSEPRQYLLVLDDEL